MKLTEKLKTQIDDLSFEDMLQKWRFAPIGDALFEGESGEYFAERMKRLRELTGSDKCVEISKKIGWNK